MYFKVYYKAPRLKLVDWNKINVNEMSYFYNIDARSGHVTMSTIPVNRNKDYKPNDLVRIWSYDLTNMELAPYHYANQPINLGCVEN